jgi:hypothetical protein
METDMRVMIELEHLKVLTAAAYEVLEKRPEPSEFFARGAKKPRKE